MSPTNVHPGLLIPHHSPDDPVRQAHERIMSDTTEALKAATLSLRDVSKQVQDNNVTTARVAGSVEAIAARVEGLASRIGNVDQRITSMSETVEVLREDIHDDLKEIKDSQKSDRTEINGIRSVLNEYVGECREYRAVRLKDDIAADKARGVMVPRHTPDGDYANGDSKRGIVSSIAFSVKQPWFWVVFLGFMFGLGGVELVSSLSRGILDAVFGKTTENPVGPGVTTPSPTPTPTPAEITLSQWVVE